MIMRWGRAVATDPTVQIRSYRVIWCGRYVATTDSTAWARLTDPTLRVLCFGQEWSVSYTETLPDTFLSGSYDGTLKLWDLRSPGLAIVTIQPAGIHGRVSANTRVNRIHGRVNVPTPA
eukprot:1033334-Prorocentrum_minimum.AAC.3